MKIKSGYRQALVSFAVFCALMIGLASFDPRVKEQLTIFFTSGNGITSVDDRAMDLGRALVRAVKDQSIDNQPMMVFVAVGAVLFVIMLKT